MNNRAKLLREVFRQGFRTPDWRHRQPLPVVSLEDFFEGNTDRESIAPNLDNHPGTDFFYSCLKDIRSDPTVEEVLVNIYDLDPIIDGGWPYTENVHILTSASEEKVQEWATKLLSDGAMEGWPCGEPESPPKAEPGYKWWSIVWD
jgi:hypothetical protein